MSEPWVGEEDPSLRVPVSLTKIKPALYNCTSRPFLLSFQSMSIQSEGNEKYDEAEGWRRSIYLFFRNVLAWNPRGKFFRIRKGGLVYWPDINPICCLDFKSQYSLAAQRDSRSQVSQKWSREGRERFKLWRGDRNGTNLVERVVSSPFLTTMISLSSPPLITQRFFFSLYQTKKKGLGLPFLSFSDIGPHWILRVEHPLITKHLWIKDQGNQVPHQQICRSHSQ